MPLLRCLRDGGRSVNQLRAVRIFSPRPLLLANHMRMPIPGPMTATTDTACPDPREALRDAGLRLTRQREAIVRALGGSRDHPDANDLLARARAIEPSVSLATVYRTMAVLTERGIVSRLAFEGAPARFETADAPHHDHIVDVDTGDVIEFISAEIEAAQRRIAWEHGYDVVWHKLELHCRRRAARD